MSRIRTLEAIPIGYPEPNDDGRTRHVCLIKLLTDDGIVGWGEAVTYWPEASRAVVALVDSLVEVAAGCDVSDTERLWRALRDHAWWYGNGGVASIAIAGIDLAAWDAKGKALGARVLDLLGGPVKDRLPAIASGHAAKPDIGALAAEGAEWVAGGLQGIKVGFGKKGEARLGFDHDRDVEYVRRLRAELPPDTPIMIDLGVAIRWDVAEAVRRVRAFEEHDLYWIEEPLGHWNPAGYQTLREKTTTRIAYGEKEFGVEGVERVLGTGTCDVLGFDPGRAEGLTAFRHVVERVEAAGTQANAHAWSAAIVSAASLAISWATPVCRQFEVKPIPDVAQRELVARPLVHEQGWMPEPQGHGLGVEVLEEVVQRLRLDR
jgi:L-alanine-DL-glutamate epimerase-like enolase superfamily enzyme